MRGRRFRRDLRDDDGGHFVGDNGLALAAVYADRLEGARAHRLLVVGHPVAVVTLKGGRNGLWRCAGSCTHAPQAAVNDIAAGSETGSKHNPTAPIKPQSIPLYLSEERDI